MILQWSDFFPVPEGYQRPTTEVESVPLPTQGRLERQHLYEWIVGEESYVAGKFDDQRDGHDDSMRKHGMSQDGEGFWFRQIVQYYDRARLFLDQAKSLHQEGQHEAARNLEMRGQQALAKAFMTAKGCVESSIRVFGPLPKPGLSSGYVEEWID